jgi:hypothetical protein
MRVWYNRAMTTKLRARFDGHVLIPEGPVELPTECVIELDARPLTDEKPKTTLQRLAEIAAKYPADPDSPGDAAAQHDHYLYGTPKRGNP